MHLAQWQTAIARLLTEPALRESFRADAEQTLQHLGVDDSATRSAITAWPVAEIEFAANGLIGKRRVEATEWLGAFAERETFRAEFCEFAMTFVPIGFHAQRSDAAAFLAWFSSQPTTSAAMAATCAERIRELTHGFRWIDRAQTTVRRAGLALRIGFWRHWLWPWR